MGLTLAAASLPDSLARGEQPVPPVSPLPNPASHLCCGTGRARHVGRGGETVSSIAPVKGVILAGGTGSRLDPLTRITNKHLLPIYDRPMVSYSIEALVRAGLTELMLVTGGTHAGEFFRLLGNGHEHGIGLLTYAYQEKPGGIAEALGLAQRFVDGDRVCVMLADNVLERTLPRPRPSSSHEQERGARILLARESDPEHLRHLGVPELDGDGRVVRASSRSRPTRRASTRSPASTSTTSPSGTCSRRSSRPAAASSRSPT